MILTFTGEAIEWRGPPPYIFVRVPESESADIKAISKYATYGWGCIPCQAEFGKTKSRTALFPKNGHYLVPVKVAVQKAEGIKVGDIVKVTLDISINPP